LLRDASFYQFLEQIDVDLADRARQQPCRFCGNRLHSANYLRKPRGLPADFQPGPGFCICYSACCRAEGCRRRHRAPSVRFLGRKVYLGVVVLLISAMRQGPSPPTAKELRGLLGVDLRTLARWRHWWQALFPASDWWRRQRGRFFPPVVEARMPLSLLAAFTGGSLRERVLFLLTFLSPMATHFF
jgi:hypothetical protein